MILVTTAILALYLIPVNTGLDTDPYADTMRWRVLIQYHADAPELPPSLLGGIVFVESRGDPYAVSEVGAIGLAQVMPRETGFPRRPIATHLRDPNTNLHWAKLIFLWHYNTCGKWLPGALASYAGASDKYCNPTTLGWWYVREVLDAQQHFIILDYKGGLW